MTEASPPPTPRALFIAFLLMGLSGFGGVLPWARRVIVEQRRWLSPAEFTDTLALCQFLPGPNVVNVSIAVGARFHGARGALSAISGLLAAPVAIVIGLGALYARFGGLPAVRGAFIGLAAAASGLVLANALKIAAPIRHEPLSVAIAATAFAGAALLRLPLVLVLAVLVLSAIGAASLRRRRRWSDDMARR
ncbi:MAG TPA: chromate transporter [Acidisphaera sp.]|nr:chromate transporter [Acidisphaera sp.]